MALLYEPRLIYDLSGIEDSVIMFAWNTYTDDLIIDDLAIDNFADTSGIETGSSSGYTASTGYISPSTNGNMVLVSQDWEASLNDPKRAFCVLNVEPIDAITYNTDLTVWVSIDDGANYTQILELALVNEIDNYDFLRGDLSNITPRVDKTIRLKIIGHNNESNTKRFKLHAWALGVRY
jgi:hypothetical protein